MVGNDRSFSRRIRGGGNTFKQRSGSESGAGGFSEEVVVALNFTVNDVAEEVAYLFEASQAMYGAGVPAEGLCGKPVFASPRHGVRSCARCGNVACSRF